MVVATAPEGYPTSFFDVKPEELTPSRLERDALAVDMRVAARKPCGELVLGRLATLIGRDCVMVRPDINLAEGTVGPAQYIDLGKEGSTLFPHPQQHLPGIDFAAFATSATRQINTSSSQERFF